MTFIIIPELTDEEKALRAKILASEKYANLRPKRNQSAKVQSQSPELPSTTETSDSGSRK